MKSSTFWAMVFNRQEDIFIDAYFSNQNGDELKCMERQEFWNPSMPLPPQDGGIPQKTASDTKRIPCGGRR